MFIMYFYYNMICVRILSEKRKRRKQVMGMTMTQKILAAHAGLASVTAGQLIEADLDLVL